MICLAHFHQLKCDPRTDVRTDGQSLFECRDSTTLKESSILVQNLVHSLIRCRGAYSYAVGSFPFLRVEFHFVRRFGYYFFAVYLPSFIVVLLSWVAFWIDLKAVPARICIGLELH